MAICNEFLRPNARATRFGHLDLAPSACTLASRLLPNSPLSCLLPSNKSEQSRLELGMRLSTGLRRAHDLDRRRASRRDWGVVRRGDGKAPRRLLNPEPQASSEADHVTVIPNTGSKLVVSTRPAELSCQVRARLWNFTKQRRFKGGCFLQRVGRAAIPPISWLKKYRPAHPTGVRGGLFPPEQSV